MAEQGGALPGGGGVEVEVRYPMEIVTLEAVGLLPSLICLMGGGLKLDDGLEKWLCYVFFFSPDWLVLI